MKFGGVFGIQTNLDQEVNTLIINEFQKLQKPNSPTPQ
jgi:hypothetical protein